LISESKSVRAARPSVPAIPIEGLKHALWKIPGRTSFKYGAKDSPIRRQILYQAESK
jgi:hypothetical protein